MPTQYVAGAHRLSLSRAQKAFHLSVVKHPRTDSLTIDYINVNRCQWLPHTSADFLKTPISMAVRVVFAANHHNNVISKRTNGVRAMQGKNGFSAGDHFNCHTVITQGKVRPWVKIIQFPAHAHDHE
jgi:hypothetical protein